MPNQYSRDFITLKQESSKYSLLGNAIGRCVIDLRGDNAKIHFSVQNLKPDVKYKAYIMANENNEVLGLFLGYLTMTSKGKGELKKDVNSYNVEDTKLSINNFKSAILFAKENELLPVLVGHKDEEIYFKNFKELNPEENYEMKEENEVKENNMYKEENYENIKVNKELEENEKILLKEIKENEIEKENEIQKEMPRERTEESEKNENEIEKNKDEEVLEEEFKDFVKNIEDEPVYETFKKMAKKVNREIEEIKSVARMSEEEYIENEIKNKNINENTFDNLEYVFKNNINMKPFAKDYNNMLWVRISLKETAYLPIDFWKIMKSSLALSSFKKYRHLILGQNNNYSEGSNFKYILGIPDLYKENYKLEASKLGFNNFKCCDNVDKKDKEPGYWIMKIK